MKPRTGAWTVLVNGKPVAPAGVTFVGKHVQLRLPAGVYSDDVARVVGRNLRSAKGTLLRSFDAKPANRSSPGCSDQLGTMVEGPHREGPTDPATFLPANRFRFYVVRVDFPDYPAPTFAATTMDLSALDREIRDLSYGRSSVTSTGFSANIRLLKNATEYVHNGAWSARRALVQDVVAQIDSAQAFVHPLLQLAGLPSVDVRDVGSWDRMYGFGQGNLVAWHRRKLGWLEPAELLAIEDDGSYRLRVSRRP